MPILSLMALLLLSACMLGPDYRRPDSETPSAYKEAPLPWKPAAPEADAPKGDWWELFGDPVLTGLQKEARENNQQAKAAYARLKQISPTEAPRICSW